MTSTQMVERASLPAEGQEQLIYWPTLSTDEQAFVAAYVENSYSVKLTADALGWGSARCSALLKRPHVRRAVKEVQESIGEIDFLNESWVKAQLLRLMPMVMGDEPVPMVTSQGDQVEMCTFKPEIAMRIVEYVAPKKTGSQLTINQVNVEEMNGNRLSQLAERLVALQSKVRSNTITVDAQFTQEN